MNIARLQRRMKKLAARFAKGNKKKKIYERKLKVGGTERRKASLKRRIKRANARLAKIYKKIQLLKAKYLKAKTGKVQKPAYKEKKPRKRATKKSTGTKKRVHVEVPKKTKTASSLPPEMVERIIRAANRTFDAIAGDLLTAIRECGDGDAEISQMEAIESVFDADRMNAYGGDKEAYEACKELDWDEVVKIGKKAFPYKSYS